MEKPRGNTVTLSSVPVDLIILKRDLFSNMESTTRVSGADNESRWKIPRNYHVSRHATYRSKTKFSGRVKCLTLQPSGPSSGKSKMILGLKDPKDYLGSEYEPSPQVEPVHKRTHARSGLGLSRVQPNAHANASANANANTNTNANPNPNSPRGTSLILRESPSKVRAAPVEETHCKGKDPALAVEQEGLRYKPCNLPVPEKDLRENGNVVHALKDEDTDALYDSPEHNEENSRAFMESIGSWINDLFSAPNKRSISPKDNKEVHKELVSQDDTEYLKSISTIKEQFRKKLKSETTVHISTPETPFELNFDKVLDTTKKLKRKQKLPPRPSSSDWLDELNEDLTAEADFLPRQHHPGGLPSALVIRSGESEAQLKAMKQKNLLQLATMDMPKERKKGKSKLQNRRNFKDLDEYNLPKAGELSKKILLNMSDQEKFSQFYKNAHLGAQDYGPRKGKGYQTNTRCYTTKAKGRGKLSGGTVSSAHRNTHYSAAVAPAKSFAEFLAKNPMEFKKNNYRNSSRKAISEMSRDTMTFAKMKTPAPFPAIPESKPEPKTTSDELVKNLIKKIKNGRQQLAKKKGRTRVPQVLGNGKNRFMQSATNSLVMTVMTRKEENSLTSRSSPRLFGEHRIPPTKDLVLKQSENAMRLDFAKPPMSSSGSGPKFTKTSYNIDDEDFGSDRGNRRFLKQSYDDILNRDTVKNEKYYKRQEVKRMLSNLEMKGVFPLPRSQAKKEQQKKQSEEEEHSPGNGSGEPQNPRFQKEHELFKKIIKTQMEQLEEADTAAEPEEPAAAKEVQAEGTSEPSPVVSELAVVDQNTPEPNEQSEKKKVAEPQSEVVEQKSIVVTTATTNKSNNESVKKETEVLCKKPLTGKTEKKAPEKAPHPKEKVLKIKTPREHEHKSLTSPLMELCGPDIPTYQRDMSKSFEVQIPPKELSKSPESLLINRRYSTNSINEGPQKSKFLPWNYISPSLYLLENEKDKKEKKKEGCKDIKDISKESPKVPKASHNGSHCGFEVEKEKPGPECSKN